MRPVIVLAFANSHTEGVSYLRNLPRELNALKRILEVAEEKELCEVEILSNVTVEQLFETFQKPRYRHRIAVFHYAGHAESFGWLLEHETSGNQSAHTLGIVPFLASQSSLKLVFINGCYSAQVAAELTAGGIPAVIGTVGAVSDRVAGDLAIAFYYALVSGLAIEKAWKEAVFKLQTQFGADTSDHYYRSLSDTTDENSRGLFLRAGDNRFPWELSYREGDLSILKTWNLPAAAGKPFLLLPDLPSSYQPVFPPYQFLKRYQREDALIFFGRGDQIFELYQHLTSEQTAPVLLLYGKSGVGKSALLRAGLIPRLETDHRVMFISRDPTAGLPASFARQLVEAVGKETELPAEIVTTQLVIDHWRALEKQGNGRGLILIVDQLEEVFTRPNADYAAELEEFLQLVSAIFFDSRQRPKGKLVLSYRKEYDGEIETAVNRHRIYREKFFIERIGPSGLHEIVEGLTTTETLRRAYQLEVETGLADMMANHLLADTEAAVAPILQIILAKMWQQVEREDHKIFTIEQYLSIKKQGIYLEDFFYEQLGKVRQWENTSRSRAETSGLALDLLNQHLTELGTAKRVPLAWLRHQYRHCADELEKLLRQLQEVYLLVQADTAHTILPHDTLGPIVQKAVLASNRPGQRAYRILQTKIREYRQVKTTIIEAEDLQIVEDGTNGMRAWTEEEETLIAQSRAARAEQLELEARNRRFRKRVRYAGVAGTILFFALSLFSSFGWLRSVKNEKQAQANYYTAQSLAELYVPPGNPEQGLRYAQIAWEQYAQNPTVLGALFSNYYAQIGKYRGAYRAVPTSHTDLPHNQSVVTAAFSADGQKIITASKDSTAAIWDLSGRKLQTLGPMESSVYSAFFSPDSRLIVTASGTTVHIWQADGQLLHTYDQQHAEPLLCARFSTDGAYLISTARDGSVIVRDMTADTIKLALQDQYSIGWADITLAGESPLLVTGSYGPGEVKVYDLNTAELKEIFLHENYSVFYVEFSPDGRSVLSASLDNTARIWDLETSSGTILPVGIGVYSAVFSNDQQYVLTASTAAIAADIWRVNPPESPEIVFSLLEHSKNVTFAEFSSDQEHIVTASDDGMAKLWSLQQKLIPTFSGHEAPITAIAVSGDGAFVATASRDQTIKIWQADGTPVRTLRGHTATVSDLCFTKDDQYLISVSEDQTMVRWDYNSGQMAKVTALDGLGLSVACFTDEALFISGDESSAKLWNTAGELLFVIPDHPQVSAVAINEEASLIITGSLLGTLHIWQYDTALDTVRLIRSEKAYDYDIAKISWHPNGRKFISSGDGAAATIVWSAEGQAIRKLSDHSAAGLDVAFATDGHYFASIAETDHSLKVYTQEGTKIIDISLPAEPGALLFLPGPGRRLLLALENNMIVLEMDPVRLMH